MSAPNHLESPGTNYQLISKAIHFLIANRLAQPSLGELAREMGLSESHLQRLFSEWAGVTPKQFLGYLTNEHVKSVLKEQTVLDSALAAGLSGAGRLHDLMLRCEGMTPGEYKSGGVGVEISYGFHRSQFGDCLLARTQRGLCKLAFFDSEEEREFLLEQLREEWPLSKLTECQEATGEMFEQIFQRNPGSDKPLTLVLKGTPFRLKVWEAMLRIPEGCLTSYQRIAVSLGMPAGSRAVGSAIGANSIGLVIPCHRVIRSSGVIGEYRWGGERKVALIGWEQSQRHRPRN